MLTGELRSKVDKVWMSIYTGGILVYWKDFIQMQNILNIQIYTQDSNRMESQCQLKASLKV